MLDNRPQRRQQLEDRSTKRGREIIIESARNHFRFCSKLNISRIDIAKACGVVPALISYHFKDNKSLVEAVTKPLISAYCYQLWDIQAQKLDDAAWMRSIIRLLIVMNADDLFLVDYLLQDVGQSHLDAEDRASLEAFRVTISRLLSALMANGEWRRADPTQTRLSLWGTCRILGQSLTAQGKLAPPGSFDRTSVLGQHVDYVYAMFADPGANKAPLSGEREDPVSGATVSSKVSPVRSDVLVEA